MTVPEPQEVETIIQYHTMIAVGAGVVPVPVVDMVALTGIQANMIRELAGAYQVPFAKEVTVNLLTSVLSKTLLIKAGPRLILSLVKFIPGLGQLAGSLSLPVLAGASTYATGQVFNRHFAAGGTLQTFEPDTMKDYYHQMFKEGQQMAATMRNTTHDTPR